LEGDKPTVPVEMRGGRPASTAGRRRVESFVDGGTTTSRDPGSVAVHEIAL
jgi:hypothetical protein